MRGDLRLGGGAGGLHDVRWNRRRNLGVLMHGRWRWLFFFGIPFLLVVEARGSMFELGLHGDDRERGRRDVGDEPLLRGDRVRGKLGDLVGRNPFAHAWLPHERVRRKRRAREGRTKLVRMNDALYALRICPAPLFAAAGHSHLASQG